MSKNLNKRKTITAKKNKSNLVGNRKSNSNFKKKSKPFLRMQKKQKKQKLKKEKTENKNNIIRSDKHLAFIQRSQQGEYERNLYN